KLLIDRKMIDNDGNIIIQEEVKPNFDFDYMKKLVNEEYEKSPESSIEEGIRAVENLGDEELNARVERLKSQKNADTRLSVSTDSSGRKLTAEQAEYFKNSKARDENGNLLVMYHGSPNAGFTEFRSGTYFTPMKWYADGYQKQGASMLSHKKTADNPDTYEVYLNIEKPFDTRNPKERRIFEQEYYRQWGTGAPLSDSGLPDWTDGMDLQEFIEEKGYDYDGLILDEGAVGGYGEEVKSRGLSYVVFSPEQVKNMDNQTPTNSADIRYSTGSSRYQQRVNEIKNIKHKREVSKVYSNTIKNSTLFNEAEKNIELNASEYEYDVKSEKESLHRAAERLENDHAGTAKELMHKKQYTGEDLDAAMFLLKESIESGRETGNYNHAKSWLKKIQEAGTEAGRMIQAYAKYSRTTAEGIAVQAQRYVQQAEDKLKAGHAKGKIAGKEIGKDKDSRKWQKVEGEVKKAQKAVEDAEAMASKSAQKELEMRVKAYKAKHYKTNPNPKAKPEPDFADKLYKKVLEGTNLELEEKGAITGKQIVDELYQKLKENGMPDYRGQREKRNYTSLEYLKDAVQRKAEYAEVFEKTQEYMKAEYGNDPEVLQLIKDAMNGNFSNLKLDSVYSKKTVEKAVKETAELFDIDFKEIIKQSKGDKDEAAQVIVNHIMQFTDVPDADAKKLADDVVNAYCNELKRMTDQRLKQLFPELVQPQLKKASKKKTTWFEDVMELINLGAYDNQDIVDIIKQKNDLPVLTSADIETIYSEVEKANQYKKYSYEWKSHMAKAQQVAADKMPQSMKNKVTQLKRIMMLSNPRTDVRNLVGNMPLTGTEMMSNAIAAPIDKMMSEKRGTQRTISAKPELGAFAQGFAKGFGETVSDIKQGVNTYRMGEESTTQYEMPRGRTFDNAFLNGIDKAVNYGLMFGDRPFFEGHYNKRMAELERLGYDITSDEAKADAYGHAVDMVFQSDSDMAKGASGIREALNNLLTVGDAFALGDFVIP
ncbi:MAG: hypothetical protein IIV02_08385, partial [Peptococcaceae bacterium]|nr:hypothetical protein [Peptococcaceae bacterium]